MRIVLFHLLILHKQHSHYHALKNNQGVKSSELKRNTCKTEVKSSVIAAISNIIAAYLRESFSNNH